jgi:hypothetical protein
MYASYVDEGLNSPCEIHEIPVKGRLYYCSGKEKGSSAREVSPITSEEIEKDAIKAISYIFLNCSIYVAILRAKTSVYMRLPHTFTHKESNVILYLLESEAHVPESRHSACPRCFL